MFVNTTGNNIDLRQVRLWSSSELSPQSSSPSQIQDWEIQRPLAHRNLSDQQVGSAGIKKETMEREKNTEKKRESEWDFLHLRQVSGSSDPSSQSDCPSHFQLFGIHPPFVQLNSSTRHLLSPLVAEIFSCTDCLSVSQYIYYLLLNHFSLGGWSVFV